jgi:hypothetical protein
MTCSQCGSNIAAGSAACPNCGAQQPGNVSQGAGTYPSAGSGGPGGPGGPGPAAKVTPAFNFEASRWTRDDRIVGGATLVFLIALFLPWFTAPSVTIGGETFGGGSVNGLWHGYMFVDLILAIAVLAYLVLRAGFEQLPFALPFRHEQLLLAASGILFVLALISFFTKPSGAGWGIGAYLGLLAAIVATAALAVPFVRARSTAS